MIPIKLAPLAPELVLLAGMLVVLMVDAFSEENVGRYLGWLGAIIGVAAALAAVPQMRASEATILGGMVFAGRTSAMAAFWIGLVVAATSVVVQRYNEVRKGNIGSMIALLLASAMGGMLLARSAHLGMLFLALELLSIPLYALAAYDRDRDESTEAGIKYFIIGSVGSAFALYGIAILYGVSGTLSLEAMTSLAQTSGMWIGGFILLAVGLLLKLSIVPFHFWTADVYEGAPTPVTLFMAGAVKIAAFSILFRILTLLPGLEEFWFPVFYTAALVTMVVGNLMAVVQNSVKRMLAFSSIAHAGYILSAVVAGGTAGYAAAYAYLWVYVVATVCSFGLLIWFGNDGHQVETYDDLNGAGQTNPWAAAMFALTMLSLGSIPPTAGFFPKLMILQSLMTAELYMLAVVLVLASAVGVYYYLRVIVHMYFKDPVEGAVEGVGYARVASGLMFASLSLLIIAWGVRPNMLWNLAERAARSLLGT